MAEQAGAFEEHVITDLHELDKTLTVVLAKLTAIGDKVDKLDAELEEFRPLLALFRPGNGTSDLQRAGTLRALRKAARGGSG